MRITSYQGRLGGLGADPTSQDLWDKFHEDNPAWTLTEWKEYVARSHPEIDTSAVVDQPKRPWWPWILGGLAAAFVLSR